MEGELYKWIFDRGRTKARVESILTVLETRGIAVSDTIRARILACTDMPTLEAWLQRAAVLSTAAAVVRGKTPPRVPPPQRPAPRARKR